jgi:hypothetical protein
VISKTHKTCRRSIFRPWKHELCFPPGTSLPWSCYLVQLPWNGLVQLGRLQNGAIRLLCYEVYEVKPVFPEVTFGGLPECSLNTCGHLALCSWSGLSRSWNSVVVVVSHNPIIKGMFQLFQNFPKFFLGSYGSEHLDQISKNSSGFEGTSNPGGGVCQ